MTATEQDSTTSPALEEQPKPVDAAPLKDDFDSLPEWAKDQIKSLRKENADRRTRLSSYEKDEEDRKQAQMSEIEKAQNAAKTASERATALEAKLIERDAIAALERANIIDAELGLMAIKSKITVENGEATNLSELVSELVKAKPHLVKQAAPEKPVVPDTKPTSPAAKQDSAPRQRVWGKI